MLCRVTNDQPSPRVLYDVKRRPIAIEPGKSTTIDLHEETYETQRALALAKCGPQIEIVDTDPEPEPEPRKQQRRKPDPIAQEPTDG